VVGPLVFLEPGMAAERRQRKTQKKKGEKVGKKQGARPSRVGELKEGYKGDERAHSMTTGFGEMLCREEGWIADFYNRY